jgi:hypothetical protein
MRRFMAVLVLALVGLCWFLVDRRPLTLPAVGNSFIVAVLLPLVMNPTRHWREAFWRCVDLVYTAAVVGASIFAIKTHTSHLEAITVSIVPGLLFGTMASLGVGRSGLADISR